jgi:hypothetical protein
MKNTGRPAVSGSGAMGVIGDQFVDANKLIAFPRNWPAHRVPTPEEQARMMAAMQRREQLMEAAR